MKGIFFIGILLVMGYFLYSFYGKETGMAEGGVFDSITDAPEKFKNKAEDAMEERRQKMKDRMNEHMPDQ